MGREVQLVPQEGRGREFPPAALVGQDDTRLIAELGVPAAWFIRPDNIVDEFLALLGQRGRADHAEGDAELVELLARLHAQAHRPIQPACIGAFPRGRICDGDITRHEHALAEGIAMANLALLGEPRHEAGQFDGPFLCGGIRSRYPDHPHAVRVVAVAPLEHVVFEYEAQRPGLFRFHRPGHSRAGALDNKPRYESDYSFHAIVASVMRDRAGCRENRSAHIIPCLDCDVQRPQPRARLRRGQRNRHRPGTSQQVRWRSTERQPVRWQAVTHRR